MSEKKTFKTFKEFAKEYFKEYGDSNFVGLGGYALGGLDYLKPIADLGDGPPNNQIVPSKNLQKKKNSLEKEEDTNRIARKPGQPAGSKKHSDLYTDENPKGTIHGLGFTDASTAKKSVSKIDNSGRSHAHKIQAAIAMSQRAKVASVRAKDTEKKKDLAAAHKIYQSYIDKNKKSE